MIASSGGLIRHFGGLYSFVNTRHQGKFCVITLWLCGGWMVAGVYCNRLYVLHADSEKIKSRDLISRHFPKSKVALKHKRYQDVVYVRRARCNVLV